MDTIAASANIVTFILIGIGLFVLLSVLTLFRWFFGGRNPLKWNTEARVEAAQNPANLLTAYRDYQRRRFWLTVFVLTLIGVFFFTYAPDQMGVIAAALRDALVIIGGKLQQNANAFMEQYRAQ